MTRTERQRLEDLEKDFDELRSWTTFPTAQVRSEVIKNYAIAINNLKQAYK